MGYFRSISGIRGFFPNSVGHLYPGPHASEIFSGDLSLGSHIFGGFSKQSTACRGSQKPAL